MVSHFQPTLSVCPSPDFTAELSDHEFNAPGKPRYSRLRMRYEGRYPLPRLSLSGLVPGRLANRLALRTRAPCCKEGEETGEVDLTIWQTDGAGSVNGAARWERHDAADIKRLITSTAFQTLQSVFPARFNGYYRFWAKQRSSIKDKQIAPRSGRSNRTLISMYKAGRWWKNPNTTSRINVGKQGGWLIPSCSVAWGRYRTSLPVVWKSCVETLLRIVLQC